MKFHHIISQLLVVAFVTVPSLADKPDLEKCQQDGYNPCTCWNNYDDYMVVVCDEVPSSELESVFSKNHDLSIHISLLVVYLAIDSTIPNSLLSVRGNFFKISIVCSEFDSLLKMPKISVSDTNKTNTAVRSFEIKDCHLNSIPDLSFLRNFPKLKNVTLYNCTRTDQIIMKKTKLNFDVIVQNNNLTSNTVFTDKNKHCQQDYGVFIIMCNDVDNSVVRGDLETLFPNPGLLSKVYYTYNELKIYVPDVQNYTIPNNMIPTRVKFQIVNFTCKIRRNTKIVISANAFNIANWHGEWMAWRIINIKDCDVSQVNWAFLRNVPKDLSLTIASQEGKTQGVDKIIEMKENEVNDFIKRGGGVIIGSKMVGKVNNN